MKTKIPKSILTVLASILMNDLIDPRKTFVLRLFSFGANLDVSPLFFFFKQFKAFFLLACGIATLHFVYNLICLVHVFSFSKIKSVNKIFKIIRSIQNVSLLVLETKLTLLPCKTMAKNMKNKQKKKTKCFENKLNTLNDKF